MARDGLQGERTAILAPATSGAVYVVGRLTDVMTSEVLRRVFAIEADIVIDPRTGVPLCIPYDLRPGDNPSVGL